VGKNGSLHRGVGIKLVGEVVGLVVTDVGFSGAIPFENCHVSKKRQLVARATIEGFGTAQKLRKIGGWIDRITLKGGYRGGNGGAFSIVSVGNKGQSQHAAATVGEARDAIKSCLGIKVVRAIKGNRVVFVVSGKCSAPKLVIVLARHGTTHSIDATEAVSGTTFKIAY